MPMITYLMDGELKSLRTVPGDRELDELLQQLRGETGDEWLIRSTPVLNKRWFRKPKYSTSYTLYYGLDNGIEFQVINLCNGHGRRVAGFQREHVINYILGFLAGLDARIAK